MTQLAEDFDCDGSQDFDGIYRVYNLTKSSLISDDWIEEFNGKGMLLQNLNSDKTLSFGVISRFDALPALNLGAQDVVAICHDEDRLNVLLYSDFASNE